MEITEVRVTLQDEERLKAFVNITFDGSFIIRGMKVIEGPKGLFVSMPSRARTDGTHHDICHPINAQMRDSLETAILTEYVKALGAAPAKPIQIPRYESGADYENQRKAVGA